MNEDKKEVLINLFKCLVENLKGEYQIDGNPDTLNSGMLSIVIQGEGDEAKFILSSEGNEVFTGLLKDYYIAQCRGGGSPFLFRNIESELKGLEIRFPKATRFFGEYEDKDLGDKLRTLAHSYYDIWCHERGCDVRRWNLNE